MADSRDLLRFAGEGAADVTEVLAEAGVPAVGVTGAVVVASVAEDDAFSVDSEGDCEVCLAGSSDAGGAGIKAMTGFGDDGGVGKLLAPLITWEGGRARVEIITPTARDGLRGFLDHTTYEESEVPAATLALITSDPDGVRD